MTEPMQETQPHNISWTIDRNPDYNIFGIIRNNYRDRNSPWIEDNNDDYYNRWSPNTVLYSHDFNIINLDNTIEPNRNYPWINDSDYSENTTSRLRISRTGRRYFNNFNDINNESTFNNQTNINTRNFINNNNDFIPFINSPSRHQNIDVNIAEFTTTDEDRQCCICMEERQSLEICRLNCMHSFCIECINQHLQTNQTCPICRTQVTSLSVQNNDAMDRVNL
jgi:hypothetical protein